MSTQPTQQEIPAQELNAQSALGILIQAVKFAQSKGVFSLEDAEVISKAVKVFVKSDAPQQPQEESQPESQPTELRKVD